MAKKIGGFLKSRFLKHTMIYLFFSFLNKGAVFLLIPFFTRTLTPEEYGGYALFLMGVTICNPLLTFCVHDAVVLVYYNKNFSILRYVSTVVFFCSGLLAVHFFVLLSLILNASVPSFLFFAPLIVFSQVLFAILQYMWQVKEQPFSFGTFNFLYTLCKVSLSILAVVFFRRGLPGLVLAEVVTAVAATATALQLLWKNGWLRFCFDGCCLRFGLKLGIAYFPSVLAVNLNQSLGRFFLADRFSLVEVGIYSVGERLGAIVGMYVDSFNNVYCPWLFRSLPIRENRGKVLVSIILSALSIVLVALGAVVCVFLLRNFILGEEFRGALFFVFWSACAYALNGVYNMLSNFIYYTAKTWILSLLSLTTFFLNALATWLFVERAGVGGVVYGPLIAWAVTLTMAVATIIRLKSCIWKEDVPHA